MSQCWSYGQGWLAGYNNNNIALRVVWSLVIVRHAVGIIGWRHWLALIILLSVTLRGIGHLPQYGHCCYMALTQSLIRHHYVTPISLILRTITPYYI